MRDFLRGPRKRRGKPKGPAPDRPGIKRRFLTFGPVAPVWPSAQSLGYTIAEFAEAMHVRPS